jgi:hypothetical protein
MTEHEDRPSYFILLGLDPGAPWDEQAFRRALAEARKRWTKEATGPQSLPKTGEAKRYLELIRTKTIERTMADPAKRGEEAQRALHQKTAALAARRKDFEARLSLLSKRGYLLEQEATALRRRFGDILDATPALAERLDKVTVHSAQNDPAESRLDAAIETQLRDQLKNAQARSIYDVLRIVDPGITEQSPRQALLAAADKLYTKEHRKKNKSDPAIKARERLSGMAKTFFKSDEERAKLHASMGLAELRDLVDWFLDVLSSTKAMSSAQVESFLREARTRGVDDLDAALRYLRERLVERGWAVELPAAQAEERVRQLVHCPSCGELNEPTQEICAVCPFPLREPCPRCGEIEPRYGGCRCGFPIGQRNLVQDLIVQAREALDAQRLPQAQAYLDQAERIWRLPEDTDDSLAVELRGVRSRWTIAHQRIEQAQAAIDSLIASKRFLAALDALRTAPEGFPQHRERLDRAEKIVREARELCELARRASTKTRKIELYKEALGLCADLEAARSELGRIPPDPPRNVRATIIPDGDVLINWEKSNDSDVSYVVVRRTGGDAPKSPEDHPDQRRLAESASAPWHDRSASEVAGLPLTYAVFATRFGAHSAAGVAATVMAALDAEVLCTAGDGQVTLTWRLPPRAERVEITRKELGGPGPEVTLPAIEPGRLVDTDVRNEVRYRYTVRVGYPDRDGGLRWSAGHSEQATPIPAPTPPGPLEISGSPPQYRLSKHRVEIHFPPPERGVVEIVRRYGAESLREGDQVPENGLERYGFILRGTPPLIDHVLDEAQRFLSYVPVLLLDGRGYVGKPRRYAIREEVSDLRGEFAGESFILSWSWPDESDQALVGHRTTDELSDVTAAERALSVPTAAEESTGGCVLPVRSDETEVHVIVALAVQHDGLDFVTAGVRRHFTRPEIRVEYNVRRTNARKPSLVLTATRPVELPAMVLCGRPDRPPYTREDGAVAATLGPLRLTQREPIPLPRGVNANFKYRLFTVSPGTAPIAEFVPV